VRDGFTTAGHWPGFAGVEVSKWENGEAEASLVVEERHLAPNGYLHAGVVVTLADTACGFGCMGSLPDGAHGFTTIELKTNFEVEGKGGSEAAGLGPRRRRLGGVAAEGGDGAENFLATARTGRLRCDALLVHGGRTTQVWDAAVVDESGKTLALFRCTQLLVYQ
jgi:uncharacterized protein (TIGR00369 family)